MSSDALANFVANGTASAFLIIPLIMLAIIFSASASVAGIAQSILLKFSWHEKAGPIIRISSPLVVAIAAPVAFVGLISTLAPKGPFRTDLVISGALNVGVAGDVVAGALIVGAVFTAREFGIQRLERLEFARGQLAQLLQKVSGQITEVESMVGAISSAAPTVSVGGEEKQLQEFRAYFNDVSAGLRNASYLSLQHWIEDITTRLGPHVQRMPEGLRIGIVDELNKMTALATTYNNQLDETGVQLRLPDLEVRGDMTLQEALKKYREVTSGISDATTNLFSEYSATTAAFNQLMNKELVVPPIDPHYLLETHDYPAAMKLVSEDYWVSFNLTHAADISRKANGLAKQLQSLSELVDGSTKSRMTKALELLPKANPATSREVLEAVNGLIPAFTDSLGRLRLEFEQMDKLVKSLTPGTTQIVQFEMLALFGAQERLAQRVRKLNPNFDDLADFADDFAAFMTNVSNARKEDTRIVAILSQYQLAKKYIETLAADRKAIPLADLPFQHDAAVMYVKLLAEETRTVRYDDSNEEIVFEHAKV